MTQKALSRVLGSAIAIVLAATMTVVGTAGSAHADWGQTWTHFDNMEPRSTGTAADRFFLENDGPSTSGEWVTASSGQLFVHSGLTAARVYRAGSWLPGESFAAVGKYVTVTPRAVGYWPTCQFSAWVYSGEGGQYNVEVIDPATWNYISLAQFTERPAYTWNQVTTGKFNVPSRVVLRVSYLTSNASASAFADDFRLTCTY